MEPIITALAPSASACHIRRLTSRHHYDNTKRRHLHDVPGVRYTAISNDPDTILGSKACDVEHCRSLCPSTRAHLLRCADRAGPHPHPECIGACEQISINPRRHVPEKALAPAAMRRIACARVTTLPAIICTARDSTHKYCAPPRRGNLHSRVRRLDVSNHIHLE